MTNEQYGELLTQAWNVWKENVGKEITKERWDKIIDKTKEIWIDSGQDKLVTDMIMAFIDDIDRKDPTRKENK